MKNIYQITKINDIHRFTEICEDYYLEEFNYKGFEIIMQHIDGSKPIFLVGSNDDIIRFMSMTKSDKIISIKEINENILLKGDLLFSSIGMTVGLSRGNFRVLRPIEILGEVGVSEPVYAEYVSRLCNRYQKNLTSYSELAFSCVYEGFGESKNKENAFSSYVINNIKEYANEPNLLTLLALGGVRMLEGKYYVSYYDKKDCFHAKDILSAFLKHLTHSQLVALHSVKIKDMLPRSADDIYSDCITYPYSIIQKLIIQSSASESKFIANIKYWFDTLHKKGVEMTPNDHVITIAMAVKWSRSLSQVGGFSVSAHEVANLWSNSSSESHIEYWKESREWAQGQIKNAFNIDTTFLGCLSEVLYEYLNEYNPLFKNIGEKSALEYVRFVEDGFVLNFDTYTVSLFNSTGNPDLIEIAMQRYILDDDEDIEGLIKNFSISPSEQAIKMFYEYLSPYLRFWVGKQKGNSYIEKWLALYAKSSSRKKNLLKVMLDNEIAAEKSEIIHSIRTKGQVRSAIKDLDISPYDIMSITKDEKVKNFCMELIMNSA